MPSVRTGCWRACSTIWVVATSSSAPTSMPSSSLTSPFVDLGSTCPLEAPCEAPDHEAGEQGDADRRERTLAHERAHLFTGGLQLVDEGGRPGCGLRLGVAVVDVQRSRFCGR